MFAELFSFHAWARARVLAAAEQVPYEGLRRPVMIPGGNADGSLHATLAHIAATQTHWLARFQGDAEHRLDTDYVDLRSIGQAWRESDQGILDLVASDGSELHLDLERPVRYYRATTGGYEQHPLWQLLLHVSNHTTHHRAEACAALTALGVPPESTDLVEFLRRS
jgi:uncharacterized damage-inducible protein DinB